MNPSPHPYDQLFPWRLPKESLMPLVAPVVESVFPSGKPRLVLYTQISKVQNPDEWVNRVLINTLAQIALEEPALAQVVETKGINAPECQKAVRTHWRGFVFAVGYPTETVDFENYVLFALIFLQNTVLIEQVHSRRNGTVGGWNLVRILSDHLANCTSAIGIKSIHVNATNVRAAALFEKNGFAELTSDLFQAPVNFRKHLVRCLPAVH